MHRIVGIGVAGSVAAVWYVVTHGIGNDYRPLGADGPVFEGRWIVFVAAAVLLGLVCLVLGLARRSISTLLAGVLLLVCAGSALSDSAQSGISTVAGSVSDEVHVARECRHILDEDPELASRLVSGRGDPAEIVAEAAQSRAGSGWSDADRECLTAFGTWAVDNARSARMAPDQDR